MGLGQWRRARPVSSVLAVVVAAGMALLPLHAAGEGDTSHDSSSPSVVEVRLRASQFSPASVTVKPGDSVKFTNEDSFCHTVTRGSPGTGPCTSSGSQNESDFDVLLDAGESFERRLDTEGSFTVYCKPHVPGMSMKITVSKDGAPQKTPGFEALALFLAIVAAAALTAVFTRMREEKRRSS